MIVVPTWRRGVTVILATVACVLLGQPLARAADRFALVVTGASGGPQYAERYDAWRVSLVSLLRDTYGYPEDHVTVLAESATSSEHVANRENVRTAFTRLRARATAADTIVIILIGHGASVDGDTAKFNLVGPDLSVREWADLIRPLTSRVVVVNAASGSFPYLETLAGRNRLVITANDSAAQQFETVMPEFFIDALGNAAADADKNGKLSVWEAFSFASAAVKRSFEERGQLATERPLLDDTGDGQGREAESAGADGFIAQTTYFRADPVIPDSGNPEIDALRRRRAVLEGEIDQLRVRKETIAPEQYENALEKLLIELAQIDRRLRNRS